MDRKVMPTCAKPDRAWPIAHAWQVLVVAILSSVAGFLGNSAAAFSLSVTGAELFSDPRVNFPNTRPMLTGSSLVFGPGNVPNYEKLMEIEIAPSGQNLTSVVVEIDVTRLTEDYDPHFMIGDGLMLIGGNIFDNSGSGGGAVIRVDQGNTTTLGANFVVFSGVSFPAVGQSLDVTETFAFGAGSVLMTIAFGGNAGDFSFDGILDASRPISFFIVRDNDSNERYQINRLAIETVERIDEPSLTAILLAAGLLMVTRRSLPLLSPRLSRQRLKHRQSLAGNRLSTNRLLLCRGRQRVSSPNWPCSCPSIKPGCGGRCSCDSTNCFHAANDI